MQLIMLRIFEDNIYVHGVPSKAERANVRLIIDIKEIKIDNIVIVIVVIVISRRIQKYFVRSYCEHTTTINNR